MKKIFALSLATIIHIAIFIIASVLFFLVRDLPLLGTAGFESANFFVVTCAPLFALAAVFHRRPRSYRQAFSIELVWLFFFVLFISSLLLINGLYLTSCSQGAGFLGFLFVLIPPLLLNVSIGVTIACLISQTVVKILVFVFGYCAYVSLIIFCWWQDPNFRLITHGSVLITSDLLKGDVLSPAVLGFRTSTLMLSLAIIFFGINFLSDEKFRMFNGKTRRPILSISLILLIISFQIFLNVKSVEAIGKNRAALMNDYTLTRESENFRIFADPTKTKINAVEQMLDEAIFYKRHIKKQLGALSDQPITIWLHQTAEEKFLYTGARNVHFALPKHREIHIAGTNIPHEVLGHELAHIFVGEFSKTLLGLPGEGFLIPNLALTEGMAVFLTKELSVDNNLTIKQQAQALYQADIRVDIDKLFSNNPLYFAMTHPRSSYIYSGATLEYFLNNLEEEERIKKIKQIIKHGSLDILFTNTEDKAQKMADFFQILSEKIPPYAVSFVHKTFPKSSILTSDCSEKQVADRAQFRAALLNLDIKKIEELIAQMPSPYRSLVIEKTIDDALNRGGYTLALSLIEQSEKSDRTEKAELMLKQVEALINLAKFKEAWAVMENVDEEALPLHAQRLVAASHMFFRDYFLDDDQESLGKIALLYLFSRPFDSQVKLNNFAYRVGEDSAKGSSPLMLLSHYLLARVLMYNAQHQQAKNYIELIVKNPGLLPSVIERESMIMFATLSFALGDFSAALRTLAGLIATSTSTAEKLFLLDQRERILMKHS